MTGTAPEGRMPKSKVCMYSWNCAFWLGWRQLLLFLGVRSLGGEFFIKVTT
jgi:hypothetical protein